jgi:hypothetical protein
VLSSETPLSEGQAGQIIGKTFRFALRQIQAKTKNRHSMPVPLSNWRARLFFGADLS